MRKFILFVLTAMLLSGGCEQYAINEALWMVQDAQLTCIEIDTDRCALPS